jgi:hypothetical protein
MQYPKLTELNTYRDMVDVFKGYNHNLRIGNGEFYDMTNLTSDDYPVLSPRRPRGVYAIDPEGKQPITNAIGLIAKDSLCYVANGRLYINGSAVQDTAGADMSLNDEPKTLISMGAYVIIMPDKKYVNTEDSSDCGKIEADFTSHGSVKFELCKLDGSEYENMVVGNTAPESPENMTLWLDTASKPNVLRQYSTTSSQWASVATTYIKISSNFIGLNFEVGDSITISGIKSHFLQDLNSTMVVQGKGVDYLIVTGIIDNVYTQTSLDGDGNPQPISVKRQMPAMDFIIESGNRLWGCRYGVANNGQVVNEIYASKLGDFKNWNTFHKPSISTDSYVASVGTDGQFTGAITHLGYPIFFKENYIHKVYGNYPANYQIQTTACRGVQKDSHKSLGIVNETLFYKSRSAVCAYDGSLPVEMSSALGDVAYSDAVAGVLGNKYYISMKDTGGAYHLFVYDTKKGMWHREDNTQAVEFCACRGELYYIDYADKQIKTVRGTGSLKESTVKWSAETGIIGTDSPDKKSISRIDIRMSLKIGTRVFFYVQYDSSGEWEHIFTMQGTNLRSFAVPIRPQRCDHLRLRIDGTGEAKIFSICKTSEQGSDI